MSVSNVLSARGKRLLQAAGLALAVAVAPQAAMAISASPHPVHVTQPDGTEIVLRTRGNERFHWEEDANGYTVLFDGSRYVYARRGPDGNLTPTDLEVGQANPRAHGLAKRALPAQTVIDRIRANAPGGSSGGTQGAPEQAAPSGAIANLVIPIRFSNHVGRTVPDESDLNVLFNNAGPHALAPTGSLRDVYLDNSYGQMTLDSTIADWATVSNSEQYYANGASGDQTLHQALIEALDAADAYIDFSQFDQDNDGYIDSITFVHSGYGAEWGGFDADNTHYSDRIWSHRWVLWDTDGNGSYNAALDQPWESEEGVKVWDYHISPTLWSTSGSNIGHIGVIAHETGHFFGLPDLYDTNGGGEGIGSYGLMANSWGFDGSQLYPPHMSPWSKTQLGWVASTTLSISGSYALQAVEDFPEVYRIDQGFPSGEYLLIENRQATGFDGDMPQGGLAIWHIDEQANDVNEGYPGQLVQGTPWPENGRHYRVALLQADGNYNLERGNNRGDGGDVWHGGGVWEINGNTVPDTNTYQDGFILDSGNRIFNISGAGATMTFDYDDGITPQDPPAAPTGLSAVHDGNGNVVLAWTDNAIDEDDEDGYRVFRDDVEIKTLPKDSETYTDSNLADGVYDYYVQAHNSGGWSDSNTESAVVILPEVLVAYASSESTTYGTVTGSYADTVDAGDEETIRETESGGKKQNRMSRLYHVWQLNNVNPGGSPMVQLYVNAYASGNSEGDDYRFSYSTDGGASYQTAFVLGQGSGPQMLSVPLAPGANGTVHVRVEDEDRTAGRRSLDSVSVRQLYIEWSDDVVLTAPSNLVATRASDTSIELTWSHGTGHDTYNVEESDGAEGWLAAELGLSPTTDTYTHSPLDESSSHSYQVCGIDLTSAALCSNVAAATTEPDNPFGNSITVTATLQGKPNKRTNEQKIRIQWIGAAGTNVDVKRDGVVIAGATANDGTYTDSVLPVGEYLYQVCETSPSTNCSSPVSVNFN